jgi:dTDP-4-dehydrorhamnose reductase
MKKALVTGLNGRIAPYLKQELESRGVDVIAFDRNVLDIENRALQAQFVGNHSIDAIFHLAMGAETWVATLAGIALEHNIPFIYTSTESVFEPSSVGPFTPDSPADATGEYGAYKIACEQAARAANPNSIIARLGWQMFDTFEKDNLLTHVRDMHDEKSYLEASTEWKPAVAFVGHTMDALVNLAFAGTPGTYNIGGNEDGLTFYELVSRINTKYNLDWDIREGKDPSRDGRIIDDRLTVGRITEVL